MVTKIQLEKNAYVNVFKQKEHNIKLHIRYNHNYEGKI